MGAVMAKAAAAFIGTNLDDILVLMLLFAGAGTRVGRLKITLGQYLGLGVLTAVSMLCGLGLAKVPEQWLRLLGLVPIFLALRAWRGRDGEEATQSACGVLSTAALTIANGGDNLGVYIPLFAGFSTGELAVTAAVFALLCGLWCLLGARLSAVPAVAQAITRHKGWLVPLVLLLLGLSILF